jgi:hypothetical protein
MGKTNQSIYTITFFPRHNEKKMSDLESKAATTTTNDVFVQVFANALDQVSLEPAAIAVDDGD